MTTAAVAVIIVVAVVVAFVVVYDDDDVGWDDGDKDGGGITPRTHPAIPGGGVDRVRRAVLSIPHGDLHCVGE